MTSSKLKPRLNNEWLEILRDGRPIVGELKDIKKGDKYRVCTPNFLPPWRIAASDAEYAGGGRWNVIPTTKGRRRPFDLPL